MSARRILVLHGPNLNLRTGPRSLEAIDAALRARAVALGVELKIVQSNWEGALLDALAAERHWCEAVILNPATLAPAAVALAEALELIEKPAIEVQLDAAPKAKSALKDVVERQISGKGLAGYLEALVALAPKAPKPSFCEAALGSRPIPIPAGMGLGARTLEVAVRAARAPEAKSAASLPAELTGRARATEKGIRRETASGKSLGRDRPPELVGEAPVESRGAPRGKSLGRDRPPELVGEAPAESRGAPRGKSLGRAAEREPGPGGPRGKSIGRDRPPESNGRETAGQEVGRVLPSGQIVKSLGARPGRAQLVKRVPPSAPRTIGGQRAPAVLQGILSRAAVRQQIADRLAGDVTPSGLAAWARAEWQKLQSGSPIESGQREKLEDVLQQLLLSAALKPSDDQLIELMTQLSE